MVRMLAFSSMHIPSLIERKRDGARLADREIADPIAAYASGGVPDYQMSAFLRWRSFSGDVGRRDSGVDGRDARQRGGCSACWRALLKVDKHSTGGIGEQGFTLFAPLLACDSLWVLWSPGAGSAITGGTLDKLESIPGFNVSLGEAAFLFDRSKIGVFMAGQTMTSVPPTSGCMPCAMSPPTVPSRPLIIASIMSKSSRSRSTASVLDVDSAAGPS